MPLSEVEALAQAKDLVQQRATDKDRLDKIHAYLRGKQPTIVAPSSPTELRRLAQMSRVNLMEIVVSAVSQTLYVDGFRQGRGEDDEPAWKAWQANKLDARQIGVHRSALTYGISYVTVLPGEIGEDKTPVIRGYSPRRLTALYDIDNPDWPEYALCADVLGKWFRYRLYDKDAIYTFRQGSDGDDELVYENTEEHEVGVTPVVRFLNSVDLDEDLVGEIEPLMTLQDQIDLTTFSLLVSQHYQAFRQRYIIGWVPETEAEALKSTAGRVWLFDDPDVKVGDFEQTDLKGYLESREASLRHAATISQTPVHELIGQLVNLSAEALVAAEAGQRRKVVERQKSYGESWEQVLGLAGQLMNAKPDSSAQVRWADTESRALSATVDALGKMAQMLGIPPQMLWERIPNVTQQDVERWTEAFDKADALAQLSGLLDTQMGKPKPVPPKPATKPVAA